MIEKCTYRLKFGVSRIQYLNSDGTYNVYTPKIIHTSCGKIIDSEMVDIITDFDKDKEFCPFCGKEIDVKEFKIDEY